MYPVDFPARLAIAQRKNKEVNCISAVHFLLGLTDIERFIDPKLTTSTYMGMRFRKVITVAGTPLILPDKAVAFGVTGVKDNSYWHMGIISPYDRSKLIERFSYDAPIVETPFEKVLPGFSNPPSLKLDFFSINPDWFYPK